MSMFGSFLPSLGRQATTVYSGRGSRHCYAIKWLLVPSQKHKEPYCLRCSLNFMRLLLGCPRHGNLKQKGESSMESIAQYKRDETWAPTEKKLARIAFDKAFERQCTAITQEARRMLETSTAPSDIFRVQEYLTEQRRIVDQLYDYRYSQLLGVFGRLLSDGWLREGDLHGLQPEKIAKIKHEASFFAEGNL